MSIYEKPVMDVLRLEADDVIVTSMTDGGTVPDVPGECGVDPQVACWPDGLN